MLTLRLTQQAESQADHYRVEVVLEGGSIPRQAVTATFAFQMTEQEREDLRWYLEEFLINPHDPAPAIAAKVERRMREIGIKLFRDVFQASEDGRDLWATLRTRLDDTRIELVTGVRGAAAIPWEDLSYEPGVLTPGG